LITSRKLPGGCHTGTTTLVAGPQALADDLDLAVGEQAGLDPDQLAAAVALDLDRVAALGQGEQGVDRDREHALATVGGDRGVHRGLVERPVALGRPGRRPARRSGCVAAVAAAGTVATLPTEDPAGGGPAPGSSRSTRSPAARTAGGWLQVDGDLPAVSVDLQQRRAGRALSPTAALRLATRTGPGCQTASAGRRPGLLRPSTSCQRCTAALVAQVEVVVDGDGPVGVVAEGDQVSAPVDGRQAVVDLDRQLAPGRQPPYSSGTGLPSTRYSACPRSPLPPRGMAC
jgi:hypothetical protein